MSQLQLRGDHAQTRLRADLTLHSFMIKKEKKMTPAGSFFTFGSMAHI